MSPPVMCTPLSPPYRVFLFGLGLRHFHGSHRQGYMVFGLSWVNLAVASSNGRQLVIAFASAADALSYQGA